MGRDSTQWTGTEAMTWAWGKSYAGRSGLRQEDPGIPVNDFVLFFFSSRTFYFNM